MSEKASVGVARSCSQSVLVMVKCSWDGVSFGFRQSVDGLASPRVLWVRTAKPRWRRQLHQALTQLSRQRVWSFAKCFEMQATMQNSRADCATKRIRRQLTDLSSLWRRLGLGSASGVVCAAAHDHVGFGGLPGDHCERGVRELETGVSIYGAKGLYGGMQVAQGLTHL